MGLPAAIDGGGIGGGKTRIGKTRNGGIGALAVGTEASWPAFWSLRELPIPKLFREAVHAATSAADRGSMGPRAGFLSMLIRVVLALVRGTLGFVASVPLLRGSVENKDPDWLKFAPRMVGRGGASSLGIRVGNRVGNVPKLAGFESTLARVAILIGKTARSDVEGEAATCTKRTKQSRAQSLSARFSFSYEGSSCQKDNSRSVSARFCRILKFPP
jgi:hypothetical protein